jgi:hypothetical protein
MFMSNLIFNRAIAVQAVAILLLWTLLLTLPILSPAFQWDLKLTVAAFIAIPAAVIGVAQLIVTAHVQRAAYIKDYALRYRTDKELTESYHYLVYRFGNTLFDAFMLDKKARTTQQQKALDEAQLGVAPDLCFFNPKDVIGTQQERRLDNLLGFFNTLGYDLERKLVCIEDISGMFGVQLDHFVQRKIVNEYLLEIEANWPKMESFHDRYNSPVPFTDLRRMINAYIKYRKEKGRR